MCLCHQVTEPLTIVQDAKTIYYVMLVLQGEDFSWLVCYLSSLFCFCFVFLKISLTTIQCFVVFPLTFLSCGRSTRVFGIKPTNLEATNTVGNAAWSSLTLFSWAGQVQAATSWVHSGEKVNPHVPPLVLAAPFTARCCSPSKPRHWMLGLPLCLVSAPPTPRTLTPDLLP